MVRGVVFWFDVGFEVRGEGGGVKGRVVFSTSPESDETHWKQVVFFFLLLFFFIIIYSFLFSLFFFLLLPPFLLSFSHSPPLFSPSPSMSRKDQRLILIFISKKMRKTKGDITFLFLWLILFILLRKLSREEKKIK